MRSFAIDEETISQLEVELDLDQRAQKVQDLFEFKSLYDQMDFNPEQNLAITKAIIKLKDSTEDSNLVERKPRRKNQFEDNMLVFYESNCKDVSTQHYRPLYVTV